MKKFLTTTKGKAVAFAFALCAALGVPSLSFADGNVAIPEGANLTDISSAITTWLGSMWPILIGIGAAFLGVFLVLWGIGALKKMGKKAGS